MDIAVGIDILNPWKWLRHEEEQRRSVPVRRCSSLVTLTQVHKHIDRMFGNMVPGVGWSRMIDEDDMLLHPNVDVVSPDKEYSITVETLGVDENGTKPELTENGQLIITGVNKQDTEQETNTFYCVERSYSFFRRSIPLPEDAIHEYIHVSFKDGELTTACQRRAAAQELAKRIYINEARKENYYV